MGTKTSIRTHVKKGIACITENEVKRGETKQEPTELISKTKDIFVVKPFMEKVWRQIEWLLYFVEELAKDPTNSNKTAAENLLAMTGSNNDAIKLFALFSRDCFS